MDHNKYTTIKINKLSHSEKKNQSCTEIKDLMHQDASITI